MKEPETPGRARAAAGVAAILLLWTAPARSQVPSYVIHTVAGLYPLGDGGPAAAALLFAPSRVALDRSGNLFIVEKGHHRVRRITPVGEINTVAGNGTVGFSGDGGAATEAQLNTPNAVAVDAAGNLYIADSGNQRIRRVTPAERIDTIAGTGISGFNGDGLPGTESHLDLSPEFGGLAVGPDSSVYFSDSNHHRIRRVILPAGLVASGPGAGDRAGFSGDGGPAAAARLRFPAGLAFDREGNLYIADSGNHRIRRVSPAGLITTVAGNGAPGAGGDDGPALLASLNSPSDVAADADGNLFIADTANRRLRRVSAAASRVITTMAATGLSEPTGVAVSPSGILYIADQSGNQVRALSGGIIATLAGASHFGGDTGPATSALLFFPDGVAVEPGGNFYIGDRNNHRIRRVDPAGVIRSVAGSGLPGFEGDGGPGLTSALAFPRGVAVGPSGRVYFADSTNHRVRRIEADGRVRTVAGSGLAGFSGDGGLAATAELNVPTEVAVDAAENLYIADSGNHRVRLVTPDGLITTFAGSGPAGPGNGGFDADGRQAAAARLNGPTGVAVDTAGNVFIADTSNQRIRAVNSAGVIRTVAGSGVAGSGGDGGPAPAAQLNLPRGVALDAGGVLFISDQFGNRIRRVLTPLTVPAGLITTIAGDGTPGFAGDGGRATAARLNLPGAVAIDRSGNVFFVDTLNHRIRKLTPAVPMALNLISGNNQTAPAGSLLPGPLAVRVLGPGGLPLPGVTVTFAVTSGVATLGASLVTTDPAGTASITVTLGNTPGEVTITASVPGLSPVTFTATATAVAPAGPRIAAVVGAGLSLPSVRQISPNAIVTIFGEGFAPPGTQRLVSTADLVDGRLPTRLAGVCVQIGPERAPLFHIFPAQINLQAPTLAPASNVAVEVILNCGESNEARSNIQMVEAQAASPEFFYLAHNQDGRNPIAAINASRPGQAASPGDVLTLFLTGLGLTNPPVAAGELPTAAAFVALPVTVTIGGAPLASADVLYTGVTRGLAGLYQLNLRLPAGLPQGDLPVTVQVGDFRTPPGGFLAVQGR